MALRFIDGFKHYGTTDLTKKWTTADGAVHPHSEGGPTGGGYASFDGIVKYMKKTIDHQMTWIIGFRYYWVGNGIYIARLWQGSERQITLAIDPDGNLWVGGGVYGDIRLFTTDIAPVTKQVWRYIEMRVDFAPDATGHIEVRVDGDTVINYTGTGVGHLGANVGANTVGFDQGLGGNLGDWITDFYACDGTGPTNNDFLGDVEVQTLYPNAAGYTANWSPLSGENWQNVDETVVDGDASYVYSNTTDAIDLYSYSDILELSGVVHGIQHNLWVRKVTSGSVKVAPVTRFNESNYVGTGVSVPASYVDLMSIEEMNPNTGSRWLISDVNTAEFGQKVTS